MTEQATWEGLPEERQRLILGRLTVQGRVVAAELAREFAASEDTIRRDLRHLAAAGLCKRVYGGALPVSGASTPLARRLGQDLERKRLLGERLAGLIRPGQLVFVDAGSTNLEAVRAIPDGLDCTLMTNAPSIGAAVLGRAGIELVMLGGRVDPRSGGAVGATTLRELEDYRPDLYLLGACALDPEAGVAAFGFEESRFKRVLAGLAGAIAVAVTNDKLGTAAPFRVAGAVELDDLVVEADAFEPVLEPLRRMGIRIHPADPAPASPEVAP
jgi:DeoR/GlpR family transcriptional regulator of sugar metabolism